MKGKFSRLACVVVALCCFCISQNINKAHAEDDATRDSSQNLTVYGADISISPISEIVQLSPSSTYEKQFTVTNDGDEAINFEVFAAPYSYIHSEADDTYTLGFTNENNFTQLTRWTKIMDSDGNYVRNPRFSIQGKESMEISYRINTPDSMPAGGQYEVIFVHTIAEAGNGNGIKTEASPGIIIYGRAEGETTVSGEISALGISQTITKDAGNGNTSTLGHINATAKVKNTGNIDFNATAVLKVEGIFGGSYYETPENKARTSVIPESELVLSDEWENTPIFGLYKATWKVTAAGETQTIEQVIFINPVPFIIVTIIILTIIITWITIVLRKRKQRRARLAV